MAHGRLDGGTKFYKIVKHVQLGTGFWKIIPITIWHQTIVDCQLDLDRLDASQLGPCCAILVFSI